MADLANDYFSVQPGHQTDYDSFVDYEAFTDLGPYRFHITSSDATLRGLLAANIQP